MRDPGRLTLLFVAMFSLLYAHSARADALRKVDRAASGGGGRTGSASSSSSSGGRSGGGGSSRSSSSSGGYHSHGGSGSYDSGSSFSGTTYSMSAGNDQCGMHAHSSCPQFDSLGGFFFSFTFGSPWMVPRLFDDPTLLGYAPYPFYRGPGVLRLAEGTSPETDAQGVRNVALAVDFESGYLIQGVVPASLAMRLQLPRRFEIDSRVNLLTDILESPAELAALGTSHVSYRFAQGKRFDFRTGLGLRLFTLDTLRLGFDILYAVDSYIANNVVLRVELHMGSLSQAFAGQARATLGAMFGRAEVYAGYDHTAFISEAARAKLGGPVVGVRAWF